MRTLTSILFVLLAGCSGGVALTDATAPVSPGPNGGRSGPDPRDGGPATADAGTLRGQPDAGSDAGTVPPGDPPPPPPAPPPLAPIFPADSPWNTRIDDAPVDPNSDAYIASMGANGKLVASWDEAGDGLPYVEVPGDQKKVAVSFWGFPDESDPGPYPIPWSAPVQIGSDGHVLVVDRDNGWLYELFKASRNADGSWQASNGARWNLRTGAQRPLRWTSADAAGMPVFPGLVRYDEVSSGWISHALRFAVNWSQRGFVSPARHAAGTCALGSNCPPMGLRVRLKKSVDISGFSWRMRVILLALQQYGMFVADNTGTNDSWWLAGAPEGGWSDEELLTLGAIRGSDFEVVAHGDLQPQ